MNQCLEVNHNGTQHYNLNAKKQQMLIQEILNSHLFLVLFLSDLNYT